MMTWMGDCGLTQSYRMSSLRLFLLIQLLEKTPRIFRQNPDVMIRVARTSDDPPN